MSFVIIFPSDYFKPNKPDEMFNEQAEVFAAAGFECKYINLDNLPMMTKLPVKQLSQNLQKLGLELYEPPVDGIYKLIHWRNDIRRAHELKGIDVPIHTYVKPKLENSKVIIEIHKGKDGLDFDHMHITDRFGNLYDKHLNNLTAKLRKENPGWHENKIQDKVEKLPEAHIKIKEFVELNMRPENV